MDGKLSDNFYIKFRRNFSQLLPCDFYKDYAALSHFHGKMEPKEMNIKIDIQSVSSMGYGLLIPPVVRYLSASILLLNLCSCTEMPISLGDGDQGAVIKTIKEKQASLKNCSRMGDDNDADKATSSCCAACFDVLNLASDKIHSAAQARISYRVVFVIGCSIILAVILSFLWLTRFVRNLHKKVGPCPIVWLAQYFFPLLISGCFVAVFILAEPFVVNHRGNLVRANSILFKITAPQYHGKCQKALELQNQRLHPRCTTSSDAYRAFFLDVPEGDSGGIMPAKERSETILRGQDALKVLRLGRTSNKLKAYQQVLDNNEVIKEAFVRENPLLLRSVWHVGVTVAIVAFILSYLLACLRLRCATHSDFKKTITPSSGGGQ